MENLNQKDPGCANCAWRGDREACRVCRQDFEERQRQEARTVEAPWEFNLPEMKAYDIPIGNN